MMWDFYLKIRLAVDFSIQKISSIKKSYGIAFFEEKK